MNEAMKLEERNKSINLMNRYKEAMDRLLVDPNIELIALQKMEFSSYGDEISIHAFRDRGLGSFQFSTRIPENFQPMNVGTIGEPVNPINVRDESVRTGELTTDASLLNQSVA